MQSPAILFPFRSKGMYSWFFRLVRLGTFTFLLIAFQMPLNVFRLKLCAEELQQNTTLDQLPPTPTYALGRENHQRDSRSETSSSHKENGTADFSDNRAVSQIMETTSRLARPSIPPRKMTIRRDPVGSSLLIQQELQRKENRTEFSGLGAVFVAESVWPTDNGSYGKYLYVHHAPLLFEDIPLERYGESANPCFQPVVSLSKFMGTVPRLPFKITTNYWAAIHDHGLYAYDHHGNLRPGILEGTYFPSCRVMKQYPCAHLAGSLAEAGSLAGVVLFIP